jgi:hypothetical protein
MTLIQDALFGADPAEETPLDIADALTNRHKHTAAPRRSTEFRALECLPVCIACHLPELPEGSNQRRLCKITKSQCATLCVHTREPYKADVCLITTRAVAELRISPHSGHTIAAVQCPHCDQQHAHAPTPGRHYRLGQCRQPYIVHTPDTAA